MSSWTDLPDLPRPLSSPTLSTLSRLSFAAPTPVQSAAIPLLLSRKDVAAEAVTGSGKTVAFVVPIVEILSALPSSLGQHQVGALIVSPTRELASQISQVLDDFLQDRTATAGKGRKLTQMLLIGGRSVKEDINKFAEEGANILVCTPGRMEDMIKGQSCGAAVEGVDKLKKGLKALEILILDEADRLLSMGFEASLTAIMSSLPKQRRTGLFSATQTKDVEKLIRAGLRNPVLISVKEKTSSKTASADERTPSSLSNWFLLVDEPQDKFAKLVAFLKHEVESQQKVMLFFATCASVEYFSLALGRLLKGHLDVSAIHGKKAKREKAFDRFRKAESGILVCTDVMARGIDIPDVDWVLQFDPPSSAEAFVHRCGRTARIGRKGSALLFLLPSEDAYVEFMRINQKVTLHPYTLGEDTDGVSSSSLIAQLRDWQRNDRGVMDLANRAFVSSVQAYAKHECSFVLPLKKLPFGSIAMVYGLLRMPKMPELKNRKVTGFTPDAMGTTKSMNSIKYKDKQKESSRQEKLKVYHETGQWPGMKKKAVSEAWSDKKEMLAKRRSKKEARALKRKQQQQKEEAAKADAAADDDDLEDDYKMIKRIKKGKAKEADFDKKIELDALEDESD